MRDISSQNASLKAQRVWIAIAVAFLANSILFGTWAARLPAIKQTFGLSHDMLGLLLLLMAGGAILGFPIAGKLADRHGGARITRVLWLVMVVSMFGLAFAPTTWSLALAIICFGLTGGGMDVAMNVWATEAEEVYGRIWMPSFHAMWSLGSVLGALSGLVVIPFGWGHSIHFATVALCSAPLALWGMNIAWKFLPQPAEDTPFLPILKGKLLLVGFFTLCATLGEGAIADWSALFLIEVTQATESRAPIGLAAFATAMVIMRLSGAIVIGGLGPLNAGFVSAGFALIGALVVALANSELLAILGFVALGFGYALAMPLAMARAGASQSMPKAMAVAGVATFAYGGILLGPPLIGFIAEATSLHSALLLLLLLGVVMLLTAPAMKPPKGGQD
jgi:MFS family permease